MGMKFDYVTALCNSSHYPHFTLAQHRVSSSSVVRALDHVGLGSNPIWEYLYYSISWEIANLTAVCIGIQISLKSLSYKSILMRVSLRPFKITRPSVRVHWVACGTCSVPGKL